MIFRQSKGNNSSITNDTPNKLHVQNFTMVIYIQYKFYIIPSIGYLVLAEDRKIDRQRQTYIPPPSAGDNKNADDLLSCQPRVTVTSRFVYNC